MIQDPTEEHRAGSLLAYATSLTTLLGHLSGGHAAAIRFASRMVETQVTQQSSTHRYRLTCAGLRSAFEHTINHTPPQSFDAVQHVTNNYHTTCSSPLVLHWSISALPPLLPTVMSSSGCFAPWAALLHSATCRHTAGWLIQLHHSMLRDLRRTAPNVVMHAHLHLGSLRWLQPSLACSADPMQTARTVVRPSLTAGRRCAPTRSR